MKTLLLLFLIISKPHLSSAEDATTVKDSLLFALQHKGEKAENLYILKPNKSIRIKNHEGKIFRGRVTLVSFDALTLETGDQVLLEDIASIHGKVLGHSGRKLAGFGITALSVPLAAFSGYVVAFGGGPALMGVLPFVISGGYGIHLMGGRTFKLNKKWEIVVLEAEQDPLSP